ncbi:MAG: M20/M25/M40 family metallo-hydrolase [Thermoanaerobaculia bacterium]
MKRLLAAALLACPLIWACARETPGPGRALESDDLRRPAEEWLRQEPVRMLRDYLRIDTTAARGELEGAEFLRRFFECEGIQVETVCPAPGRCNVLARLPGRRRDGALLLLNHIDVVEAYPQFWQEAAPFEGMIKHGFLYGRGAYDMKSFGVAQALAMAHLKRRGVVPETDVLFLAEADEEIGQRWGTRWLLEHRPEWFAGVRQVLNEGGSTEMILRDAIFWGLETLQAGYGLLELEGASEEPLERLAARWTKVSAPPVEPHPHVVVGFDLLANRMASPLTDPLRHLDRVIRHPEELAILPDRFGSFLEPRMSWSFIYRHPAHLERPRRLVTISVPPGVSPEPYLRPIREAAKRDGVTILTEVVSEATSASPYPTPFTELLRHVTEARWPGVLFGPLPTAGGYTTSILLRERGIPTYGYQPIAMNITDAARRHGNDERVFLRDYLNGVDLLGEVVEEYATRPPPSN